MYGEQEREHHERVFVSVIICHYVTADANKCAGGLAGGPCHVWESGPQNTDLWGRAAMNADIGDQLEDIFFGKLAYT